MADTGKDPRPLIAHVMFRLDYGGLENGVVNIVNRLPEDLFRHTIIALTEASDFRKRIRRPDIAVHTLNKPPGNHPATFLRLYRLFRELRPAVVHTRNLATIESAVVARLAGVPFRIHGEHGWDVYDPEGKSRKYRALRRLVSPAVNRFVTVSAELEQWLTGTVGIPASKVKRICNGVDTERFKPAGPCVFGAAESSAARMPSRFPTDAVIVGSVTRFSPIKDPLNLVRAFIEARKDPAASLLRLVMVGDGPLRAEAEASLRAAGLESDSWLPGARDDVPQWLQGFDVFALGSAREGISNTVLEAMACGLPVIASATGGNLELIEDGVSGRLIPPQNPGALAAALLGYARDTAMRRSHGRAARELAEQRFSLKRMIAEYGELYRPARADTLEAA
jgi:sugar transferase (PEP-CTERM/EpsH1 system associated)